MASSVSNTTNSNILRFSGMATGLDTESIIKQLMDVERIPLEKLNQKKTILEWKRDGYRDITSMMKAFKDEFMDVLKPATNMTSPTAYKRYTVSSSNPAVATAAAGAAALSGTHTINITQLATAANTVSSGSISKELTGTAAAGLTFATGVDNQFNITLNGVTKTINLRNGNYANTAELITNGSADGIQDLVNAAFGNGKVTVAETAPGSGILKFTSTNGRVTVNNGANNALTKLNITNGASNRINLNDTLANVSLKTGLTFDGSSKLTFKINNTDFSIGSGETLSDLINKVNSSSAGVTMTYSELTDKFTITAKQQGAGANITITNTGGNLFDPVAANSAIGIATGAVNNGKDVIFDLDGVNGITRSSNNFNVDGIQYSALTLGSTTITANQDVDAVFNNIKAFVAKYNEVVDKLNSKIGEKKYNDYTPLTEEQKAEMETEEIELWEGKAKSGIFRNDSILARAVREMRSALFDEITGVSGDLTQIGISTGSYLDKGKLTIDDEKLRAAIQTNPDKVQNLFAKSSSIAYSPTLTAEQRTQRYKEEGLANRISDILLDNIRTTRDKQGNKGYLVEKAGIVGDLSEFTNSIDAEIKQRNLDIGDLTDKLFDKETFYYRKFAALEKAVSQMNSQGSWLSQQFS